MSASFTVNEPYSPSGPDASGMACAVPAIAAALLAFAPGSQECAHSAELGECADVFEQCRAECCEAWARVGECTRNAAFMAVACEHECAAWRRQCREWAHIGECESNAQFMLGSCSDACTPAAREQHAMAATSGPAPAACAEWADMGECARNPAHMLGRCAHACDVISQRVACSARACDGLSLQCRHVDEPFAYALPEWVTAPIAFRNDADVPVQLFWVDGAGDEVPYSVLTPHARLVQETALGFQWRARVLADRHAPRPSGELLLDTYAGVLVAAPCACEPHARDPALYPPPSADDADPAGAARRARLREERAGGSVANATANATAVLVVNADAAELVVVLWDGAQEVEVAALQPRRSLLPNASYQRVVSGLWPGQWLGVRRRATGELLMQHLVGDVVIAPCAPVTSGTAAPAAVAEAEGRAQETRRSALIAQNAQLRDALGSLREVDSSAVGALPAEVLQQYVADATAALSALGLASDRGGSGTGGGSPTPAMRSEAKSEQAVRVVVEPSGTATGY